VPDLTEGDVRAAVARANVPVLLMLVFHMTGDERWLSSPFLPTRGQGLGDHDSGGLDEALQEEVRAAAVGAILDLQAGREPAVGIPDPDLAARMMSVLMGEAVDARYGPMLASELARRVAPDAPQSMAERVAPPPGFRVVILGAGVSGIIAAHELRAMGVEFTVLDQQPAPGGNWWQNTYPGAGVDTPSHLYSFSFAPNDWGRHFELRDNLQAYFERVMAATAGDGTVRYGTTVRRAAYDEDARRWTLDVVDADGTSHTLTADVVLSAVGVLNRPKLPDVPGAAEFEGIDFHSSEWPAGLDLDGKRVALVGTGASAMQIGCAIAERVERLVVFQRSPQWVAPFDKFQKSIDDDLRKLLWNFPLYQGWYWLRLFWQFGDRVIEALRVDPEWEHPERSVNRRNDGHRRFFTEYLERQLEGRPDLIAKALPDYPPYGKRILLDNGWYAMLRRDNVTLVAESVARLGPHSIVSASGEEHEVDAVIWATGFDVARFVGSLEVRGVGGRTLREVWEDDNPRAYLGVSVPGFPNFFMLGGPNSFPGSGSFMYFMEVQMAYIRRLLTELFRSGSGPVAVDREVHDSYNAELDALHERMVWTHPGMSTWYRNRHGRVVFAMPFLNIDYWEATRRADLEHYVAY
jgi:4-hydroxyacetophenone monooxygenase